MFQHDPLCVSPSLHIDSPYLNLGRRFHEHPRSCKLFPNNANRRILVKLVNGPYRLFVIGWVKGLAPPLEERSNKATYEFGLFYEQGLCGDDGVGHTADSRGIRVEETHRLSAFTKLFTDDDPLGILINGPKIHLPFVKGRVIVANAEQADIFFVDLVLAQEGLHNGLIVATVCDPDGLSLQVLDRVDRSLFRPVHPLKGICLKKLGDDNNGSTF